MSEEWNLSFNNQFPDIEDLNYSEILDLIKTKNNLMKSLETDEQIRMNPKIKWDFEKYLKEVEEMIFREMNTIETEKIADDCRNKPLFKLN